jgi:hypothetical protein
MLIMRRKRIRIKRKRWGARSGATNESQNAKRKTQKSKPGVQRGGAAKENQRPRVKGKVERVKAATPKILAKKTRNYDLAR